MSNHKSEDAAETARWEEMKHLNRVTEIASAHPDRCTAYAMEGFCESKEWQHHHRCNGNHTNGPGGIELHYCDCGSTFYFVEDAIRVAVEKLFGNEW